MILPIREVHVLSLAHIQLPRVDASRKKVSGAKNEMTYFVLMCSTNCTNSKSARSTVHQQAEYVIVYFDFSNRLCVFCKRTSSHTKTLIFPIFFSKLDNFYELLFAPLSSKNRWMNDLLFYVPFSRFQSNQDNGQVIMKGCVHGLPFTIEKISALGGTRIQNR